MAEPPSSKEDAKNPGLYLAVFAELQGTLLLVLVSCGSATPWGTDNPTTVQISLTFAFTVATIVWNIAHISGGHINPAVTFSFLVARRISVLRGVLYIVAQCCGGMAGAGVLKQLAPDGFTTLGTSAPGAAVSTGQTLVIELMITFVLVSTVFATIDPGRTDHNGSGPLAIGLAIGMSHLWAVPYTGAGMNPARVLGPAVASGTWHDHWAYWVGPLIGGALAALIYDHLMAVNHCLAKTKAYFTKLHYDPDGKYCSPTKATTAVSLRVGTTETKEKNGGIAEIET